MFILNHDLFELKVLFPATSETCGRIISCTDGQRRLRGNVNVMLENAVGALLSMSDFLADESHSLNAFASGRTYGVYWGGGVISFAADHSV